MPSARFLLKSLRCSPAHDLLFHIFSRRMMMAAKWERSPVSLNMFMFLWVCWNECGKRLECGSSPAARYKHGFPDWKMARAARRGAWQRVGWSEGWCSEFIIGRRISLDNSYIDCTHGCFPLGAHGGSENRLRLEGIQLKLLDSRTSVTLEHKNSHN